MPTADDFKNESKKIFLQRPQRMLTLDLLASLSRVKRNPLFAALSWSPSIRSEERSTLIVIKALFPVFFLKKTIHSYQVLSNQEINSSSLNEKLDKRF